MKSALLAALLLVPAAARAQEYGGGVMNFLSGDGDRAEALAYAQPGGGGAPSLVRQEVRGSATLRRDGDDRWTASARAGDFALGAPPLRLPSGVVVPKDLWNLQAGGGFARRLGDRRRWGGSLGLGSASDKPFDGMRETSLTASAYGQLPQGERSSWILMLNYSNNRPFLNNVPLPGFAFLSRSEDSRLTWAAGFPFLYGRWRADDDWTLMASMFGFGNSWSLEAARRATGPFTAYARAEREPLQWLRSGRSDAGDRLVFDSSAVRLGARAAARGASLDLSLGRTFDRAFYEGRPAKRTDNKTTLPNGWLAELRASLRWGADAR